MKQKTTAVNIVAVRAKRALKTQTKSMQKIVYIALGSNIGDRQKNLEIALNEIKKIATITKQSKIHETDPVDYKNQNKFINMAIELKTKLSPSELLKKLQEIEQKMGRKREIEKGPRVIDLDILLYNKEIINRPNLKIPHPTMHQRSFVLEPLSEIAPKIKHPVLNQTINELRKNRKTG